MRYASAPRLLMPFCFSIIFIIAFIPLLSAGTQSKSETETKLQKNIFSVSSSRITEDGWGKDLVFGFNSVFERDDCNIVHVDLETIHEQGIDSPGEISQYVLDNIKTHNADMLVAIDDVAIQEFTEIYDTLPKNIPLLLAGHIGLDTLHLSENPNVWVIKTPMEIVKTISLGISLLPETKNIIVIRDNSYEGLLIENLVKKEVEIITALPEEQRPVKGIENLQFIYISGANTSTDEMYAQLKEISQEPSFVLFHNWETDDDYDEQEVYVKKISNIVDGNIFVFFDDTLDNVIGGYMLSAMEFGVVAGELAKNLLIDNNAKGYDPENFTNARLRLNWKTFVNRNFNFASLPKEASFYTPQQDIWERLNYRVISTVLMIFSGTAVMFVLMLYKQRKNLKTLNVELTKAMQAAQESEQAKSYFLATMSHELRTPLNAVIGYSELTQNPSLNHEERMHNLKNINFAANTLLSLINDILDLSKLEAEQLEIFKTSLSMKALADEFLHIFKFSAKRKNIYLAMDVQKNIPVLMMDMLRLKQILMNVIGNSIKFTIEGGIDVGISFEANNDKTGTLFISVKDTGVGIAPQNIKKIFNPFEQENNRRIRSRSGNEGTGLGLTIVKRLLEKMDGKVEVESTPNIGSTFKFSFKNVEISTLPAENTEHHKPALTKQANPEDFKFDSTVLVIDDVMLNIKVLRNMLNNMGVNVLESLSGEDALEIMKTTKPDLVMTDLWMPKMSGEELAKAMKVNPELAHIPVAAVTADTQLKDEEKVFDDVLYKPITMRSVFEILENHIPTKMEKKDK